MARQTVINEREWLKLYYLTTSDDASNWYWWGYATGAKLDPLYTYVPPVEDTPMMAWWTMGLIDGKADAAA